MRTFVRSDGERFSVRDAVYIHEGHLSYVSNLYNSRADGSRQAAARTRFIIHEITRAGYMRLRLPNGDLYGGSRPYSIPVSWLIKTLPIPVVIEHLNPWEE